MFHQQSLILHSLVSFDDVHLDCRYPLCISCSWCSHVQISCNIHILALEASGNYRWCGYLFHNDCNACPLGCYLQIVLSNRRYDHLDLEFRFYDEHDADIPLWWFPWIVGSWPIVDDQCIRWWDLPLWCWCKDLWNYPMTPVRKLPIVIWWSLFGEELICSQFILSWSRCLIISVSSSALRDSRLCL